MIIFFNTVYEMNRQARLHPFCRSNYQWFDINVDKIRSFLGIFISTGLVSLPYLEDYWKTNSIFSQPAITKGMSHNHLEQLCGQFHFNNNNLAPAHGAPGYNRLYKIWPVIDAICEKSKMLYNLGEKF